MCGHGQIIYQDGTVFNGQVFKNKPDGFGEKKWPRASGKSYKGYWIKGKMHGKGELVISEGEIYIGEFRAGFPNGKGIRKWINGDLYEGIYVNGFQQGKGMFISTEQGWKYEGDWVQGKMLGIGSC